MAGFRFSLAAHRITTMLSEGRTEDAKTAIRAALLKGAELEVQRIAADLIKPPKKRSRGGIKRNREHWLDIGEEFSILRDEGETYENCLAILAEKFGYSETHVRNAWNDYERAREAHDEESRNTD